MTRRLPMTPFPLPKEWASHVHSAALQSVSPAQYTLAEARG